MNAHKGASMTKNILVVIAGPTASGKTTVSQYLEEKYGAHRARYSAILADMATKVGVDHSKKSLQRLSTRLRKECGEPYLTTLMGETLTKVSNSLIVIEGNRRMVDMQFAETFAQKTNRRCVYIYVDAHPGARHVRMNLRLLNYDESSVTQEEFDVLENDECEEELPFVRAYIEKHGFIIDNSKRSLEELRKSIDQALVITEEKHPPLP